MAHFIVYLPGAKGISATNLNAVGLGDLFLNGCGVHGLSRPRRWGRNVGRLAAAWRRS